MRVMNVIKLTIVSIIVMMICSCAGIPGDTRQEQINTVDLLIEQTIEDLCERNPDIRQAIANSVGYAVMNGKTTKIPFIGTGSGYGAAISNQNREKTYVEITELDIGAGLGVRTQRFVIIFHDENKFKIFTSGVWMPRTSIEAGVGYKDTGIKMEGDNKKGSQRNGYEVYFISELGASATATLGILRVKPVKLRK